MINNSSLPLIANQTEGFLPFSSSSRIGSLLSGGGLGGPWGPPPGGGGLGGSIVHFWDGIQTNLQILTALIDSQLAQKVSNSTQNLFRCIFDTPYLNPKGDLQFKDFECAINPKGILAQTIADFNPLPTFNVVFPASPAPNPSEDINEQAFEDVKKGNFHAFLATIENGADINALDKHNQTLLHEAIDSGRTDIALYLIDVQSGFNQFNAQDNIFGDTPFIVAAEKNNLKVLRALERKIEVDPNISSSKNGETALMVAAREGHLDVVKFLLEEGSCFTNFNAVCQFGKTAIHFAAGSGKLDVVKYLGSKTNKFTEINSSVKKNGHFAEGDTALHIAVKEGYSDLARYLLRSKEFTNTSAKNSEDKTAHDVALKKGNPEIIKLFELKKTLV